MTQKRRPGRPVGTTKSNTRRHLVAVRLDDAELAVAKQLGMGNVSQGIQTALHVASDTRAVSQVADASGEQYEVDPVSRTIEPT